jgi:hypothetical protein
MLFPLPHFSVGEGEGEGDWYISSNWRAFQS